MCMCVDNVMLIWERREEKRSKYLSVKNSTTALRLEPSFSIQRSMSWIYLCKIMLLYSLPRFSSFRALFPITTSSMLGGIFSFSSFSSIQFQFSRCSFFMTWTFRLLLFLCKCKHLMGTAFIKVISPYHIYTSLTKRKDWIVLVDIIAKL